MRSPTKPWYRASKDAWYVQFNGRKVRLAKGRDNEKAAQQAFYRLMASGSGKLPEADTLRVAAVCDLFLDYSEKHHVPDTFAWYKQYLQDSDRSGLPRLACALRSMSRMTRRSGFFGCFICECGPGQKAGFR